MPLDERTRKRQSNAETAFAPVHAALTLHEQLEYTREQLARHPHAIVAALDHDDALAVAVALEHTDLEDLYDDLVLQGEPAFRLVSERLEAALAETNGRVAGPSGAAARLGIPPSTLEGRIRALHISKNRFKTS